MPVFNEGTFLSEAVESILKQTFKDFEFLIIDDGSTDGCIDILAPQRDSRLHVLRNEKNLGLTRSLKIGVELARGEYIARMDADDVALPGRLEKQVAYLTTYPEIGILGSACYVIDQQGHRIGFLRFPLDDLEIRWATLLASPFAHPAVMLRRDVLLKNKLNYDERFQATQDYDLWTRMLNHTSGANLAEPLLLYRKPVEDHSADRRIQLRNHDMVALRTIRAQLPDMKISLERVSQLRALFVGGAEFAPAWQTKRIALGQLYLDLFRAFVSHHTGKRGLKAVQRQEVLKVARAVLRRPLSAGLPHTAWRLVAMEPVLPWLVFSHLLRAIAGRLKRRVFDPRPRGG
jgi:hypothetical protein